MTSPRHCETCSCPATDRTIAGRRWTRATCPACQRVIAVSNGRLVQHHAARRTDGQGHVCPGTGLYVDPQEDTP